MNNKELTALMESGFAALDLQLYIDTHPDDTEAIAVYNECVHAYEQARAAFEKARGPLYSFISESNPARFSWVDTPWPWENEEK